MDGDGANNGLNNGPAEQEKRRRGRPKGVPNRATRDVRLAAQKYTARSMAVLAKFLKHEDPKVALTAAKELLDRGHGKPSEHRLTELTGKDGAPLVAEKEVSDIEMVRHIAFVMHNAAREKLGPDAILPETRDGLRRVVLDEPWSPDEPAEVEARENKYNWHPTGGGKPALPPPPEPESALEGYEPPPQQESSVVWLDERGRPGMDWGSGFSPERRGPPPNVITRKPG
jgi:hypothetical protein